MPKEPVTTPTTGPLTVGKPCVCERMINDQRDKHYPIFWPNGGCAAHVFREGDAKLFALSPKLLLTVERFIEALINGPENLTPEKSRQLIEEASVLIAPVVKPEQAARDAQRPPEEVPC